MTGYLLIIIIIIEDISLVTIFRLINFLALKKVTDNLNSSYASWDGNGGKQDVELDNFLEYYVNGKG